MAIDRSARDAGLWEDAHRELLNAIMACCDPELHVCSLFPGTKLTELEEVLSRHHTFHRENGPFISADLIRGE